MTFQKFISRWLGKKADWDGHYDGQCVDLFRFYVDEVLGQPQPKGVTEGAAQFWTNFDSDPNLHNFFTKIPNTPTGAPLNGDVVIWNKKAGGGYGHVSIFIEGDANRFVSFDQNWPTLSVCTKTEHDYKNVLGWFRPISTPSTEPITVVTTNTPKIDLEEYGSSVERQSILSMLRDKDKENIRLQKDNQDLANALQEAQKPTVVYQEATPCPDPLESITGSDTIDNSLPPLPENLMSDLFAWVGAWLKRIFHAKNAKKD